MQSLLDPRADLEVEHWPALVLDRDGIIVAVNPAWDRIARASRGPLAASVLGTSWLGHITGAPLRSWYAALLVRVLAPGGLAETNRCDCNTPDRIRVFSSRFEPLRHSPSSEAFGLVIKTTLLEEAAVAERYEIGRPDLERYVDASGLVMQCSGCRRVRVAGVCPQVWEFVPEYVASPRPNVSHGLCPRCRRVYYGDLPRL